MGSLKDSYLAFVAGDMMAYENPLTDLESFL